MPAKPWSRAELNLLIKLRETKTPWKECAKQIGRTWHACESRHIAYMREQKEKQPINPILELSLSKPWRLSYDQNQTTTR